METATPGTAGGSLTGLMSKYLDRDTDQIRSWAPHHTAHKPSEVPKMVLSVTDEMKAVNRLWT